MVTAMDGATGGDDEFPVGASLADGDIVIREAIRGVDVRGMFRARDRAGQSLLVTVTSRQKQSLERIAADLGYEVDGIARLRHVGPLAGDSHHAMVEEEPAGRPSSELELPLAPQVAVELAAELATVVGRAHDEGLVLLGLRPELVYLAERDGGLHLSGIAPRADLFVIGATPVYGAMPLFDHLFAAPEFITMQTAAIGPAADVFALSAVVAVWLTGEHPFEGETQTAQMGAIVNGRGRPWRGPTALGMALARGLERAPRARPSLSALIAGLRGAGAA